MIITLFFSLTQHYCLVKLNCLPVLRQVRSMLSMIYVNFMIIARFFQLRVIVWFRKVQFCPVGVRTMVWDFLLEIDFLWEIESISLYGKSRTVSCVIKLFWKYLGESQFQKSCTFPWNSWKIQSSYQNLSLFHSPTLEGPP